MPPTFKFIRRVEFSETDLAGIVHFANFFRYMEAAEHAFFRSLGTSVATPPVGWPRVHAECDYKRPLRFEDQVEIALSIREIKAKSITYDFVFTRLEPGPAEECARGNLVVACVTKAADGTMKAVPIPDDLAQKLKVAQTAAS